MNKRSENAQKPSYALQNVGHFLWNKKVHILNIKFHFVATMMFLQNGLAQRESANFLWSKWKVKVKLKVNQ